MGGAAQRGATKQTRICTGIVYRLLVVIPGGWTARGNNSCVTRVLVEKAREIVSRTSGAQILSNLEKIENKSRKRACVNRYRKCFEDRRAKEIIIKIWKHPSQAILIFR